MRSVTLATTASANPMGAQRYDVELATRVPDLLAPLMFNHHAFRSLRSRLPGSRRAPMAWLAEADRFSRAAVGRVLFPDRRALVHRTDLVLPPGAGLNTVTIHDTVAWRFTDESAPVRSAAAEARRADAVICVSEFTASDVADLLGVKNAVVIPNGVDKSFFDATPLDAETSLKLGLDRPYVLHAGGASQRKNLESLAAAWPTVRSRHPDTLLVLAGPEHPRRTALFAGMPGTHLLGRVPDALMPALVAGARTVVVPSHYEGFGLPVLEAMAAGTLVVSADTSALHEVTSDAGILVSPDPTGLAEGLVFALDDAWTDDALRARARVHATTHSWERTAELHVHLWRSLVSA